MPNDYPLRAIRVMADTAPEELPPQFDAPRTPNGCSR